MRLLIGRTVTGVLGTAGFEGLAGSPWVCLGRSWLFFRVAAGKAVPTLLVAAVGRGGLFSRVSEWARRCMRVDFGRLGLLGSQRAAHRVGFASTV
jgi:hypothetical protein